MATWKKVLVSGSSIEVANITASGDLSSSGALFTSLSLDDNTSFNTVMYDTSTGKFYYTGSYGGGGGGTLTIGTPTDGTYDDGLFPFTTTTTIANAVDDINELLASLAPSPAPELQDIRSTQSPAVDGTSGETDGEVTTAELSFGATNSGVITANDYANVAGLTGLTPAGNLGAVDTDGTFSATTSTDQRIGIFDLATAITGKLNETQPQNPTATGTNHGPDAFKQGHLGELRLYVNDNTTPIHTLDLTSNMDAIASDVNGNGSGFTTISATQSAHFPNGDEFTSFIHRSGSFTIAAADQRNGWNWCRVRHISETGTTFDVDTNYMEWVNDGSGSSAAYDVSYTSRTLKQRTPTGARYLSQIPYYTDVTIEHTASFNNAYIMTYVATNAVVFSDENANLTGFANENLPALGNADPKNTSVTVESEGNFSNITTACYFFTSSESGGTGTNAVGHGAGTDFGNGFGVRVGVVKPLRAAVYDSYQRTGSMFLIGKGDTNNTLGSSADYKFLNEYGRLISGAYDVQNDVIDEDNAWDSQNSSIDTNKGLIVYGQPKIDTGLNSSTPASTYYNYNRVISPFSDNYSYNGGNFSNITAPSTPPDFSSLSHTELMIYLRYDNGSSAAATKSVTLYGVNTTIVAHGTALSGNNIHCYFKVPGTTGWRDMATAVPGGSYTPTDDYVGCYNGGSVPTLSLGSTNTSVALPVQLVGQSVPANGYAVMRIVTHKDWEGYLYRVTIS